ncbi:MAG: multidrug transporter MatE [Candidatus Schekmanbacteria bacterium RBG_13_48_7]|uniref:Multidrug transporter MatE n=1 Tax=Candidatus Schekmanbacteria bacterium RBG_13_48_7 TaxID=1817878 RepID=A0A1F7RSI3_9BACT|nr:MAG: multidrug transporter MatE [Candidatus Schekmanbacteria bacterium RBG_13_48_7]
MKSRIQKWGNSLAVRIPKAFIIEAGLGQHTQVEISISQGKIVIESVKKEDFSLEEILKKITVDNLHGEVDTGHAVGKEAC